MDAFVYCVGTVVIIAFFTYGVWRVWLQLGRNHIYRKLGLRQAGQVYCDAFQAVTNVMREVSGQAILPTFILIVAAQVVLELDPTEAMAVAAETPSTGNCIKEIMRSWRDRRSSRDSHQIPSRKPSIGL